jgi:hypothetical protein
MDNDDFRRGNPTNHKVYGEAMAILAGDALLTDAFMIAASQPLDDPEKLGLAVSVLGHNAGSLSMVGGQVLDISSEARQLTEQEVLDIQTRKTGALINSACVLGVIAGGGDEDQIAAAFAAEIKALHDVGKARLLPIHMLRIQLEAEQVAEEISFGAVISPGGGENVFEAKLLAGGELGVRGIHRVVIANAKAVPIVHRACDPKRSSCFHIHFKFLAADGRILQAVRAGNDLNVFGNSESDLFGNLVRIRGVAHGGSLGAQEHIAPNHGLEPQSFRNLRHAGKMLHKDIKSWAVAVLRNIIAHTEAHGFVKADVDAIGAKRTLRRLQHGFDMLLGNRLGSEAPDALSVEDILKNGVSSVCVAGT